MRSTQLLVIFGSAAAAAACSTTAEPQCSSSSACGSCQICQSGSCVGDPTCGSQEVDASCPDGLCDPCAGMTCDTPPANSCADESALTFYSPTGACDNGTCSYSSSTQDCPAGCADGACVGDPCAGVTCTTPPANSCADASTLTVYSPAGTCDDGNCSYSSSTQDCLSGCANGQCAGDPCAGVTCTTPPANTCSDANTLTVYSTTGTCGDGICAYASLTQTCQDGCANGHCNQDPCAGVTCDTPPANSCKDSSTLTVYGSGGTCNNGACAYTSSTQACQYGCANGRCDQDPCAGLTCTTPPANSCKDTSTLTVYSTTGTCGDGACTYASSTQPCEYGCANGHCNQDTCAGVSCNTPPANSCKDAGTLTVYAPSGACSDGSCIYTSSTQACPAGCANGHCKQDPCAGVTCNTPPANSCKDSSTLTVYGTGGMCSNGTCTYLSSTQQCQYGCAGGHCNEDPCVGVTCNTPPANFCANGGLQVYSPNGTCSNGSCSYGWTLQSCSYGCSQGQCQEDPCASMACDTPPANYCEDPNAAIEYSPTGHCSEGSCIYPMSVQDCSDGCSDGQCNTCKPNGISCSSSSECCDASCTGDICIAWDCKPDGMSCASSFECCGASCTGGVCSASACRPSGALCRSSSDCCSDACNTYACQMLGAPCSSSTQCCSDLACIGGTCAPSLCGRLTEGYCSSSSNCCAGLYCESGPDICSCLDSGGTCTSTSQCCYGLSCSPGGDCTSACKPSGSACTSTSECCSGLSCMDGACYEFLGVCASCFLLGFPCHTVSECCSGLLCDETGSCCLPNGSKCTMSSECCYGINCGSNGTCCNDTGEPCGWDGDCCYGNCYSGRCS